MTLAQAIALAAQIHHRYTVWIAALHHVAGASLYRAPHYALILVDCLSKPTDPERTVWIHHGSDWSAYCGPNTPQSWELPPSDARISGAPIRRASASDRTELKNRA